MKMVKHHPLLVKHQVVLVNHHVETVNHQDLSFELSQPLN
jgi:hypothetical protein